jgi:hypothetical protein
MSDDFGGRVPHWMAVRLAECAARGQWELWRDYLRKQTPEIRVAAFHAYSAQMDDGTFWSMFRPLIHQSPWENGLYEILRTSPRPGRDAMMTPGERAALAQLPARFSVWRGSARGAAAGWFFSTDRAVAELYGTRKTSLRRLAADDAILWHARVSPSAVQALFFSPQPPWCELLIDPDVARADLVEWHPCVELFEFAAYLDPAWPGTGGKMPLDLYQANEALHHGLCTEAEALRFLARPERLRAGEAWLREFSRVRAALPARYPRAWTQGDPPLTNQRTPQRTDAAYTALLLAEIARESDRPPE